MKAFFLGLFGKNPEEPKLSKDISLYEHGSPNRDIRRPNGRREEEIHSSIKEMIKNLGILRGKIGRIKDEIDPVCENKEEAGEAIKKANYAIMKSCGFFNNKKNDKAIIYIHIAEREYARANYHCYYISANKLKLGLAIINEKNFIEPDDYLKSANEMLKSWQDKYKNAKVRLKKAKARLKNRSDMM